MREIYEKRDETGWKSSSSKINYNLEENFEVIHMRRGVIIRIKKIEFLYIKSGIKLTSNRNRLLDNKISETLGR